MADTTQASSVPAAQADAPAAQTESPGADAKTQAAPEAGTSKVDTVKVEEPPKSSEPTTEQKKKSSDFVKAVEREKALREQERRAKAAVEELNRRDAEMKAKWANAGDPRTDPIAYLEKLGVPFLGEIPLHMAIRENSDAGRPVVFQKVVAGLLDAPGVQIVRNRGIAERSGPDVEGQRKGRDVAFGRRRDQRRGADFDLGPGLVHIGDQELLAFLD